MSNPVFKLNTLLAKTDQLAPSFKNGVSSYTGFFKDKQGAFRGERRTYTANDGTVDVPGKRKNDLVVTTVDEKLKYLVETSSDYINALFSQERTNATGKAQAELTVDGVSFGTYSSLELLRLKNVLEGNGLEAMYANIPVRSDAEEWYPSQDAQYQDREIYEQKKQELTNKTTEKEPYIVEDPNVQAALAAGKQLNYQPQMATRDTVKILGEETFQRFSGEYSQKQRADILRRRTKLVTAVVEALKVANDAETVSSDMTSAKLFGYLHQGSF